MDRHDLISFAGHAAGGAITTAFVLAFGFRFMRWSKGSILSIKGSVFQLVDHAQWAHRAIRAIAEAVHANIPEAPKVAVPLVNTPPPTGPSFEEISGSWRR